MRTYRGKRIFDVAITVFVFLLLWPIFMVIAWLVWLFSGRPIFYRQTRLGLAGKKFSIYKFRTMVNGAHEQLEQVLQLSQQSRYSYRIKQDPRVTKIGGWLRRWNLDELPQFYNILKGDMSLVGPRPAENYLSDNQNYLTQIKNLRPGLTGYFQIFSHTTDNCDIAIRLKLIDKYWQEISFLTDLKIIYHTFRVVLKQKF